MLSLFSEFSASPKTTSSVMETCVFWRLALCPEGANQLSLHQIALQMGGMLRAAVALVPVHQGACLWMASPRPPSCSVMVGPWFTSQDLSAPCLPPEVFMRSGGVDRGSKLGPALSISCWKVGLPLSALSRLLLPVSDGFQFHLFGALCGRWKRQLGSWVMAGSALCLRQSKETGKRTGCLCYRLSLTW